jgi:hypothetical protein
VAWRIEWTPAAVVEAETEARNTHSSEWGLVIASSTRSTPRQRVADGPEHFERWPDDPSYRRAAVHVFPFVVFYWIDESRHTHRRRRSSETGTWLLEALRRHERPSLRHSSLADIG